jgi:hypothetical protein
MATLDVTGRRNGKNKQVVDQVIVDDELLPELKKYTWSGTPEGYAFRSLPNGGGLQYLHYFVWEHCHGVDDVPEDMFLDHKNQNKRDNQIANLQVVNDRVKNANAPKRSDNTSGFKDVFELPNGRFSANVRRDTKLVYGGGYATAVEAAYAVNLMYERLHPEIESPPNLLAQDALTDEQYAAVEANVERLLRPDRKPNEP